MNLIDMIRFLAQLIIAGTFLRLIELKWGGIPGARGELAAGLAVIY